jgi:hypothetical protein
MGMKKIDLGPTGKAVAHNVRRYRGDTSYAELSRKLAERGRPIPPLGLRHLEAGTRQVSVDELMALAMALDVAPLALLLINPDRQQGGLDYWAFVQLLVSGEKGVFPVIPRSAVGADQPKETEESDNGND